MSTEPGLQTACENGAPRTGINLQISPGQAHTRLAILERRHQVTRRALTLFLEGNPEVAKSADALVTALNYVIPQINRTPNVCGYSPIQWTLGYPPHIPGMLPWTHQRPSWRSSG